MHACCDLSLTVLRVRPVLLDCVIRRADSAFEVFSLEDSNVLVHIVAYCTEVVHLHYAWSIRTGMESELY